MIIFILIGALYSQGINTIYVQAYKTEKLCLSERINYEKVQPEFKFTCVEVKVRI